MIGFLVVHLNLIALLSLPFKKILLFMKQFLFLLLFFFVLGEIGGCDLRIECMTK